MKEKQSNTKKIKITLLIITVFLIILYFSIINYKNNKKNDFGNISGEHLVTKDINSLTDDDLYITHDRKLYQDGSMDLVIPKLDLNTSIGNSTIPEALTEKPGLYEFSQLPSYENVNVSIAGHRDIYNQEFYSLDKMEEGDYLYLVYEGIVYQYSVVESKVVAANDWSVIKRQGFSALTLTTCDPIGTTRNRLVVTGELIDMKYLSEKTTFSAS